jgi:2'-5' RNA ligase
VVGEFRRRHDFLSVARRMPPHVTVLFPFATPAALDADLRSELAVHFRSFSSFGAELTTVGRFDAHVWLAPEPRERFVELITATSERFPAYPPYEGAVGGPEPHLTIAAIDEAESTDRVVELARSELGALLPFRFVVGGVSLFEETGDGTWQESARFGLG